MPARSCIFWRWTAATRPCAAASLRRGLSYAVDRKALLEDYVIKRAADGSGCGVPTGRFPRAATPTRRA